MKLGVLLSRFPYPLEKGDKLRAYHQIRELSKRNEIYLCALSTSRVDEKAIKKLEPFCKEIKVIYLSKIETLINLAYSLLFSNLPLQVSFFYNRRKKPIIQSFFTGHKVDH